MNAADRLIAAINKKQCAICVGLDPVIDDKTGKGNELPSFLNSGPSSLEATKKTEAISYFCKQIIEAVHDIVPAVKPNEAFFKLYGSYGIRALEEIVGFARDKGLQIILDCKSNDIGSTAEYYANAYLAAGSLAEADFITVNPYLGFDTLRVFADACQKHDKGIFVLVKTSNEGAGRYQDKRVTLVKKIDGVNGNVSGNIKIKEQKSLHQIIAYDVAALGLILLGESGYSSIGAVVGATHPEDAEKLRKIMQFSPILVPGYGTQGGSADDVVPCFDSNGYGAIVNSSRDVIYAYSKLKYHELFRQCFNTELTEKKFAEAARLAAEFSRDQVNKALLRAGKLPAAWR